VQFGVDVLSRLVGSVAGEEVRDDRLGVRNKRVKRLETLGELSREINGDPGRPIVDMALLATGMVQAFCTTAMIRPSSW
jgi:hypothetical protein